jgi:hypothetical protein
VILLLLVLDHAAGGTRVLVKPGDIAESQVIVAGEILIIVTDIAVAA